MPLVTVPLLGYAPDLDPATPGVFSYCLGMEPTGRGWKLHRGVSGGTGLALDGAMTGAFSSYYASYMAIRDNSPVKDKLYLDVAGVPTDKSRGAFYTANSDWSWCQYGVYTLATNYSDVLQIRDASGSSAFADSAATGIPKAKICVTWGPPTSPRVMLLAYNDGTAYLDGWWSSHQGGPTAAWTPDIATGAANGRLFGANEITCGIAFGDDIVVFSATTMWHGRFVGPPVVVEWQRVSDKVGCIGMMAATTLNGLLYFVGAQGLWVYDGASLRRMPIPIQEELIYDASSTAYDLNHIGMMGDQSKQRIRLYGMRDNFFYSINVLNNKVGKIAAGYGSGASELQLQYPLPMTYGYAYAGSIGVSPPTFKFYADAVTPQAAASGDVFGFALPYMGSNKGDTLLRGVIPRFHVKPSTYIMTDYYGPTSSEITSTATAVTVSGTPWRADLTKTARWHAPRLIFTSAGSAATDVEVIDVMLDVEQSGRA